jgi:ATP-binding cassette subfamily C protein LapB
MPATSATFPLRLRGPSIGPDVVCASLGLNLLGLALPLVMLQVYDRVLPNESYATLWALGAGLAVVVVLDGVLRAARQALSQWSAARWEHITSCQAVAHLLQADAAALGAVKPGEHLDRLNAIETLRDFYGGPGRLALIDLPFVPLYLLLLWAIGGALVAVPLAVLLLVAAVVPLIASRLRKALARRHTIDDRRAAFVLEALGNIRTIKTLAAERLMLRRYERLQQAGGEATYASVVWSNAAQTAGTVLTAGVLIATASAGALMVMDGRLTLGGLAACTLLTGRAVQPVLRALGLWTQIQGIALARGKLAALRALPAGPARLDAGAGPALSGEIEVEGVRLDTHDGVQLFDGLTLRVAPGEMVTVAGASGSGKSTLLGVLAGDVPVQAGTVSFDGHSIADHGRALRRQIALVPQTPVLFEGTLLDNVTMFEEGAAIDRALARAEALGLTAEVDRLPGGWDTRVGEGIANELPMSVRQKVTIVRALAREPRILLLDESNSALDRTADDRLRELLSAERQHMTVVMVTLRPSIQRVADRHLILEDGRLALAAGAADGRTPAEPPAAPAEGDARRGAA